MKWQPRSRSDRTKTDQEGMSPGDRSGVEMLGVAVVGFIVVLVVFWFLTRIVF